MNYTRFPEHCHEHQDCIVDLFIKIQNITSLRHTICELMHHKAV
jgi:hypothetical protein